MQQIVKEADVDRLIHSRDWTEHQQGVELFMRIVRGEIRCEPAKV